MSGKSTFRIHVLIALICVVMTLMLAFYAKQIAQRRGEQTFSAIVNDSRDALTMRMDSYLLSLNSLAAFYEASDFVSAQDWAVYVEALDIEKTLPGVLGLGFVQPTDGPELLDLMSDVRAGGEPELVVHPNTGRTNKMIIRFIEPLPLNAAARGLDISFEANRRIAAITSRDSGLPQVTAPINLVQGRNSKVGALLLRPIYDHSPIPATKAERIASHVGWVYAPFTMDQGLNDLFASGNGSFAVKVEDAGNAIFSAGQPAVNSPFTRTQTIDVCGRTWTVSWSGTAAFKEAHASYLPLIVLLSGLSMSFLVWRYLRMLTNRENDINALVERKTRALSDRAQQNRAVIENSVFGVMQLDSDGIVRSANAASCAILGIEKAKLMGRVLSELVIEDEPCDGTGMPCAAHAMRDGKVCKLEMQTKVWRRSNGMRVQSVLLRDITKEATSLQALTDTEERWNLALQGAEIGVFDVDLRKNKSVVSETWRRLMDIPLDSDIDTQAHFFSRVHPDDLPVLQAADRDAILGNTPRSVSEFRVRMADGSYRWLRSDAVVVERDADGTALRLVVAQTDITALRAAETAIKHGEELLDLVIERAPVGTAITNGHGTMLRANGALSAITGYPEDKLTGGHLSLMLAATERDSFMEEITALRGDTHETYRGEHLICCADGEERWGLVKVSWAFDPAQAMEIYIVQINDITTEKRAARIKSEFIATISHELRTPLTSIKGALGLMGTKKIEATSGPITRLLEIATVNTDRLINLVNDILDLEKISAGKMDFNLDSIGATDLVSVALESNRPLLLKSALTFRLIDMSGGAHVLADENRIAQVLSNLLSNACKFAPPKTAIAVQISVVDDMVRFDVTDRGPGVPDAFRDRIFGAFSQADSSDTRQKGGTGLGLNISRQIVERMGGTIGFDSEPDVRTTFYFTCPIALPEKLTSDGAILLERGRKQPSFAGVA
jgi:PAS domain S-box-containing protein